MTTNRRLLIPIQFTEFSLFSFSDLLQTMGFYHSISILLLGCLGSNYGKLFAWNGYPLLISQSFLPIFIELSFKWCSYQYHRFLGLSKGFRLCPQILPFALKDFSYSIDSPIYRDPSKPTLIPRRSFSLFCLFTLALHQYKPLAMGSCFQKLSTISVDFCERTHFVPGDIRSRK